MRRPSSSTLGASAVWRNFALAVLIIGGFFSGLVAVFYHLDVVRHRELLAREARHVLDLQERTLALEFRAVRSDLIYLSRQQVLHRFMAGDGSARSDLQTDYANFARNKRVYAQVRLLDTGGQEVVRINQADGEAEVVPREKLQSKANRYYFQEAMVLAAGEVFVSPFDLNVEHGSIQQPILPVIRFLTPVTDAGGRVRGLLALNYVGSQLIDRLRALAETFRGETMLLNPEGEYLRAPEPGWEWGWLLGHGHSFRAHHPDAWRQGRDLVSRELRLASGVFRFRRVTPDSSGGAFESDAATSAQPRHNSLVLVAYVSNRVETARSRSLLVRLLILLAVVMTAVSLLSYYWARSRAIHESHERQIADSEARLRKLSTSLLDAQENERRNLSRDMHDDLGQQVTAIGLDLRLLARRHGDAGDPLLQQAIGQVDRLLESVHQIAADVRPSLLDDLGLCDAIESYVNEFQSRTRVDVALRMEFDQAAVPARVGENAYRVLQEALANVASHAGVDAVEVEVGVVDDALHMTIRDRGAGFDPGAQGERSRLGILGMRERVELLDGRFDLRSAPGEGTRIGVVIPLGDGAAGRGAT